MKTLTRREPRSAKAFTLLEMMLVVLIIGLLMAVAVMNFGGQGAKARESTTRSKLAQIKQAVVMYYNASGSLPPTLETLVPAYLEASPKDAWKEPVVYGPQPADANPAHYFTLYSKGADRQPNTQDDLSVWNIEE